MCVHSWSLFWLPIPWIKKVCMIMCQTVTAKRKRKTQWASLQVEVWCRRQTNLQPPQYYYMQWPARFNLLITHFSTGSYRLHNTFHAVTSKINVDHFKQLFLCFVCVRVLFFVSITPGSYTQYYSVQWAVLGRLLWKCNRLQITNYSI